MENFQIDENQELQLVNGRWVLKTKGDSHKLVPKELYKYYPLNEYSLDALENGYFYLSNPKDFNDPFDCNYNLITENQRNLEDWEYVPLLNDVSNKGITCFSEDGTQPLMWGHYANSYHGFVVKIKPEFSYQQDPGFHDLKLLHAIYSKSPNSVPEKAPFANQYQLVIKLDDWKYEREWRLIVDKINPDFNKLFYEPGTIQEISLGYKMHHNNSKEHVKLRHRLDDIIHSKFANLPLYSVGPDQKEFRLHKTPFKYGTVEDFFGK